MIAFRGKSADAGKFLGMFRVMAKREPNAAAYLTKIEEARKLEKKWL